MQKVEGILCVLLLDSCKHPFFSLSMNLTFGSYVQRDRVGPMENYLQKQGLYPELFSKFLILLRVKMQSTV